MSRSRATPSFNGLTALAIRHPDCVIVIPGPVPELEGHFTDCLFFRDAEVSLPVIFKVSAWCHCLWLYEGLGSLRRSLEVSESGHGRFCLTISAYEDDGEGQSWQEENTGYIFHLDGEGETSLRIIQALEQHYMFFTKRWIEMFLEKQGALPLSPSLDHSEMVKELLGRLSGNDRFLELLGGLVTDQDFRYQHGRLLQMAYDEYEAIVVSEPVVEVQQNASSLTVVHSPPRLMRDSGSLLSSCSRTDDPPNASLSLSSAGEFLERSLNEPMPFKPDDSNTLVAERFEVQVVPRGGPVLSLSEVQLEPEDATTEHEEKATVVSGSPSDGKEDTELAFDKDFDAIVAKYGLLRIKEAVQHRAGGCPLEVYGPPPPPNCEPEQEQVPDALDYAPAQTTSDVEDCESESTESDTYKS